MTTLVMSNHVPAIEQALVAAGRPVIVCMTHKHATLRSPSGHFPYPVVTISDWDAFGEIAALAHRLRGTITAVATRWEGAIPAAGLMRDLLNLPGQSFHQAVGYTDKAVMKQRLNEAGVPVAGHLVARKVADIVRAANRFGWPLVVKPLRGFASINTYIVASRNELSELTADGLFDAPVEASAFYEGDPAFVPLARQSAFLVEQYIDVAREFHVDGLWVDGEPIYQIPGLYHDPPLKAMGDMLGSVLLPPGDPDANMVTGLAMRAARALTLGTGFTHAEILHDHAGQWFVGEIAARPGGGGIQQAIAHATGLDVARLQASVACADVIDVRAEYRAEYRAGVVGWAGPAVPPGRIVEIAALDKIRGGRGVIDATVAVEIGQMGGRTGSGLWGGLAGYVYLRGNTVPEVLGMMREAAARYQVRVEHPVAASPR